MVVEVTLTVVVVDFVVLFGELIFTQTREGPLELPALAFTFRQINLCA